MEKSLVAMNLDQDTIQRIELLPRDIGWLHFALSDRFIVTTRLQPIRSVDKVRAAKTA